MPKKLTILGLLLTLAACSQATEEVRDYAYKPNAQSAYISNHVITKEVSTDVELFKEIEAVELIDGCPVVYHKGKGNKGRFKNPSVPIALAPGKHSITVLVSDIRASTEGTTFTLHAMAKEKYKIKALPIWKEPAIADSLRMVTVWIEDSKGNKVVEPVTLERKVYVPSVPTSIVVPKTK